MSSLVFAALSGLSACLVPSVIVEHYPSPPPKALVGNAKLPGKAPQSDEVLRRGWEYTYMEQQERGALRTRLHLWFDENGRYQFFYATRSSQAGAASPDANRAADGVEVTEVGRYWLSDEILLLEPTRTEFTRRAMGAVVAQEIIDNERRAYLVRIEHTRLHIAGRCAEYQIEPICSKARDVWYQLSAVGGAQQEPGRRRDSTPARGESWEH